MAAPLKSAALVGGRNMPKAGPDYYYYWYILTYILTTGADVYEMFGDLVKSDVIRNQNDILIRRFTGNLLEFGQTDMPANADDYHLCLDNSFQQTSLLLHSQTTHFETK